MKSIQPTKQREPVKPLAGLSDLTHTIGRGIQATEAPFLAFGQDLQTAYAESGDLIRVITEAANRFSETSDKSLTREADTVVRRVLDELAACPVQIDRDMAVIHNGLGHLEGLCKACDGLNNVSRYLNVIGINFAIESCRSNEATAMFDGFADEIKTLAKTSADIIEKIGRDSQDAILKQKNKMAEVREKVAQIQTLTAQAQDSVLSTMANIKAISAHSLNTLEAAQETARAVQTGTGEIVMAIQFHDIARQRLEHVISAFEDVMAMAGDPGAKADKLPNQVLSILKIQSEQMGQVAGEIDQASVNINAALDDIRKKVTSLSSGTSARANGAPAGGLDSEFKAMAGHLDHLKQIQHQAGRLSKEMTKAIHESSQIVMVLSGYTDQIRSLNINIQHKALNAIIMTSRLGENGRTLEVLAREVRNLSVSCNAMVSDVVAHLDKIAGLTQSLAQKDRQTDDLALSDKITAISLAMENQNRDTQAMDGQVSLLEGKFRNAHQGLAFIKEWSGQLVKDRRTLDDIITAVLPLTVREADAQGQSHDTVLASRYTMESERQIHQRIAGAVLPVPLAVPEDAADIPQDPGAEKNQGPLPADKSAKTDTAKDEEEEFGDNIELF